MFHADEGDDKTTSFTAEVILPHSQENVVLQVNGTNLTWTEIEDEDGGRWYWYDNVNINYGSNISYKLTVGSTNYQGTLKMPGSLSVNFPAHFNPNSDFNFTWTIPSNPWCFYVSYRFEDYYQEARNTLQLPGTTRSYSIPKSTWQNLDVAWVDADVGAINYHKPTNKFLTLAYTFRDFDDDDYYKSESKLSRLDSRPELQKMLRTLKLD